MRKFAELVLKYRLIVLALTLGMTIFMGLGIPKVRINTDMLSYLKHDPMIDLFNRIGEEYGGNTLILTVIEADDIFTTGTLTAISQLTEAYKQIPGVSSVMSLTDILDIAKTENGLEIRKLINKYAIPQDAAELARLKAYTLNKRMYAGKFISLDGKYSVVFCNLTPDANKERVAKQLKQVVSAPQAGYRLYYSGLPEQMVEVGRIIRDDLKILLPIVVIVVMLTHYFSFKSLRGIVLPLINVIMAAVCAVGLMGWLNIEMSLISNIMPVVLIAVGSAYGIHLVAKYYEEFHTGAEQTATLLSALSDVVMPVFLAGITTLIGFLTFGGSYLTSVTEFGVLTAFGVGVAMLFAVTFLPALLSCLPAPKKTRSQMPRHENRIIVALLDRLGMMVVQHPTWFLAVVLLALALAALTIPKITTESNMIAFFKETSGFRIAENLIETHFGGSNPIQMLISADLKDPFVLKEMIRLEKYMESLPDVNNTQSLADLVCEMNDVMNGHFTIPETREQVANLLFMLEGEELLEQLVNKDYTEGIIQARFGNSISTKMAATVDALNQYITREMNPRQMVFSVATLTTAAQQKLREFQLGRISAAMQQDARKRLRTAQFDAAQLDAQLRQLTAQPFTPLNESWQAALRARVDAFLRDEADAQLDTDEQRASATAAIVAMTSAQPVEPEGVVACLNTAIPSAYWQDDPAVLDDMAEFLLPILQDHQHFARIEGLVAALLPLFPNELQTDPKFREDMRDDLWGLTETSVSAPVTLNLGAEGAEVGVQVEQSGMVIVMTLIQQSLIRSQLQSLGWALILIAILMSIQFRSIPLGLVVTSPTVLTILINFAVMGIVGVAVDMATIMIASIAIGIGIDYSIHFASRLQTEMRKQPDMLFAVDKTLETTGQAILINALTVALGFLVLLGANIKPLQSFGWILAMTMFVSAAAAMTFLPALILVFRRVLFKERQYPRFPVPLMYRAPSDPTLSPVINLSLGGLRIHRAEQLKPREEVALELMLPDQTILACQARVIWQRALLDHIADARYDVGLRWVNLSDDALRQLTDVIQKYAEPVSSTK